MTPILVRIEIFLKPRVQEQSSDILAIVWIQNFISTESGESRERIKYLTLR